MLLDTTPGRWWTRWPRVISSQLHLKAKSILNKFQVEFSRASVQCLHLFSSHLYIPWWYSFCLVYVYICWFFQSLWHCFPLYSFWEIIILYEYTEIYILDLKNNTNGCPTGLYRRTYTVLDINRYYSWYLSSVNTLLFADDMTLCSQAPMYNNKFI